MSLVGTCLPVALQTLVWEFATRTVHPLAAIMRGHIDRTNRVLNNAPSFFDSPGWDLVRSCQMHCCRRFVLNGPRRGPPTRKRSKKTTLPWGRPEWAWARLAQAMLRAREERDYGIPTAAYALGDPDSAY